MTTARILIGVFFCISGGTKLLVSAQFRKMELTLAQSHIPLPHANAIFVSLVEFACGGALALGLLTPVCAVLLAVVMIVAIATNRLQSIDASGALAWLDDFLYLPEVLYVVILVWLIFSAEKKKLKFPLFDLAKSAAVIARNESVLIIFPKIA